MNTLFEGEAKIHYGDGDFTLIETGGYVLCAVTGERITIDRLRYWDTDKQEAYKDASAALSAWTKDHS